jgi:UDPglucose 6-dehydrogenase
MKVSIVGTGYVGLTTGVCLGYMGHKVTCIDSDQKKIGMLQAGKTPIYEPFLTELMAAAQPNLQFRNEYADAVKDSDVIFIAVGTPPSPDGSPDLRYLSAAAQGIGQYYDGDFLVVVNKSTVPIGSGNWVGSLVRESYEQHHGRKASRHFSVASNPEFLREGTALHDSLYADRVVIGSDNNRALEVLYSLYRPILDQTFTPPSYLPRPEGVGAVPLISTDLASAELIKYAANAFLATKISYINEIGQLAEKVGADISQVARESAWTLASERASCKLELAGAAIASARTVGPGDHGPGVQHRHADGSKPRARSIAANASAWWTSCSAN